MKEKEWEKFIEKLIKNKKMFRTWKKEGEGRRIIEVGVREGCRLKSID